MQAAGPSGRSDDTRGYPVIQTLEELERAIPFARRHIGPSPSDQARMLAFLGYETLDDLASSAVPESIILSKPLDVPHALPEIDVLAVLRDYGSQNRVMTSMIGLGYYGTHTPQVVLRNVLENPAWYTAYTPYQPEISQGRLEALLNFQTMVSDLTGLPDGQRVAARRGDRGRGGDDACARRGSKRRRTGSWSTPTASRRRSRVIETRAEPLGIDVVVADLARRPAGGRVLRRARRSTRAPRAAIARPARR